ncbi:MAG: hypothetical protein RE472_01025 [Thermoplasmatales archaeon]|nr:MAG: hypothetical protein RE472_01025 [Thermoplasmatales archaeon]
MTYYIRSFANWTFQNFGIEMLVKFLSFFSKEMVILLSMHTLQNKGIGVKCSV